MRKSIAVIVKVKSFVLFYDCVLVCQIHVKLPPHAAIILLL